MTKTTDKPTIVLDAGHGGHDPGALGPRGERECDVALSVVMLIGAMIEPWARVVYTRKTDSFVALGSRATLANDVQAHGFLSVHCNSGEPGSGEGFEVFTSPGETASDALATALFLSYAEQFPHKRKRMDLSDSDEDKEAKFTVLTRTLCPAALFELEFIHTAVGATFLTTPSYQVHMARALAEGLRAYFAPQPPQPSAGLLDLLRRFVADAQPYLSPQHP